MARSYERAWLQHDLVAGVVLTALLIPAGTDYAEAAGPPVQAGLYATVVPLLVCPIKPQGMSSYEPGEARITRARELGQL